MIEPGNMAAILARLLGGHGVDFRDYKSELVERAIEARCRVTGASDGGEYLRRLEEPSELRALIEALVVPVTAFFRDPAVFEALETHVLPALREQVPFRVPLRMWTVGVATGEEAWTLAMISQTHPMPEILGTDIDARSLEVAARGVYPEASAALVPEPHRQRWLERDGSRYGVRSELRAAVRFVRHDLLAHSLAPPEAVVASFHLVSLRNVLIYLDRRLQQKAIERVSSALEPGGVLVLGPVESLPQELEQRLEVYPGTPPALRIYRRRAA